MSSESLSSKETAANTVRLFADGLPELVGGLTQIVSTGCRGHLNLQHLAPETAGVWRAALLPARQFRARVDVPGILSIELEATLVRVTDHHTFSEIELVFKTFASRSSGALKALQTAGLSGAAQPPMFRAEQSAAPSAPPRRRSALKIPETQAPKHRRLGEVLVHMGHVTQAQVDDALSRKEASERLGRYLIRAGLITPDVLMRGLALQSGLSQVDIDSVQLTDAVVNLFPYDVMKTHSFVPCGEDDTAVSLAAVEPLSAALVSHLAQQCGRQVRVFLAAEDSVARILDQLYAERKARRAPRHAADLPVQYQFCDRMGKPIDDLRHTVLLLNLSPWGFALDRAPDLPNGVINVRRQDVYAFVTLLGLPYTVTAICQLRWARKFDARDGTTPYMQLGLEIVEIAPEHQEHLREICAAVGARSPRTSARTTRQPSPPTRLTPQGPRTTLVPAGPATAMTPSGPATEIVPVMIETASGRLVTPILDNEASAPVITTEMIQQHLRLMGLMEDVFVHEQDYRLFMQEKGIKELGRGAEGAVYFLRGHVVKVSMQQGIVAALREVAHMLHLNKQLKGGAMGERERQDWPGLLWIYVLSNGSLSIGMKPFDPSEKFGGATLLDRLSSGPTMDRTQSLLVILSLADSLAYAHNQGLIHHDLKPGNIFVPGDSAQSPVIFDLGQSIWKNNSWGRDFLHHEHNRMYWYNGTYRYMHYLRRLAQMGAMCTLNNYQLSPRQQFAMEHHFPTFYDDVYAFARILRDCVRSPHLQFNRSERAVLREFSLDLMGMNDVLVKKRTHESVGAFGRITSLFRRPTMTHNMEALQTLHQKWPDMTRVHAKLQQLLRD